MINLSELLKRDSEKVLGKPGFVIGSAKSIKNLERVQLNGIRIGIGDLPWRAPEYGPFDYWVTANSEYPLIWNSKHFKDITKSATTTLISTASVGNLSNTHKSFFFQMKSNELFSEIVTYDQRHFNAKMCIPEGNCCLFSKILVADQTIQEKVGEIVGIDQPIFSTGSTVAVHGYALAILLKLNPIYISGVEIPTDIRKYDYIHNFKMPNEKLKSKFKRLALRKYMGEAPTDFTNKYFEILDDFELLSAVAKDLGITTYNLSESSSLKLVNGIQTI